METQRLAFKVDLPSLMSVRKLQKLVDRPTSMFYHFAESRRVISVEIPILLTIDREFAKEIGLITEETSDDKE